jgi:hypothetical protein
VPRRRIVRLEVIDDLGHVFGLHILDHLTYPTRNPLFLPESAQKASLLCGGGLRLLFDVLFRSTTLAGMSRAGREFLGSPIERAYPSTVLCSNRWRIPCRLLGRFALGDCRGVPFRWLR